MDLGPLVYWRGGRSCGTFVPLASSFSQGHFLHCPWEAGWVCTRANWLAVVSVSGAATMFSKGRVIQSMVGGYGQVGLLLFFNRVEWSRRIGSTNMCKVSADDLAIHGEPLNRLTMQFFLLWWLIDPDETCWCLSCLRRGFGNNRGRRHDTEVWCTGIPGIIGNFVISRVCSQLFATFVF